MTQDNVSALTLREREEGTEIPLRVSPGSKRSALAGVWGTSLRVQIAAPPREGKANQELKSFLAKLFGIKKTQVELLSGESSRDKLVLLRGIKPEEVRSVLQERL